MEKGKKLSNNFTNGYLATPQESNGKKILVLHAWWGLNKTIKDYCDRFADEGFVAFAPDLYHGKLTDEIEQAEVFSNELSLDQARLDLEEALKFIQNQPPEKVDKVALIGFWHWLSNLILEPHVARARNLVGQHVPEHVAYYTIEAPGNWVPSTRTHSVAALSLLLVPRWLIDIYHGKHSGMQ